MYQLAILPSARRKLKKLPLPIQQRIRQELEKLCEDPYAPTLNVKALRGRDGYRLRVGDYRVLYLLDSDRLVVTVADAGHRKDIYQ